MSSSSLHSEKSSIINGVLVTLFIITTLSLVQAQEIDHITFVLKEAGTEQNIANVTLQIKELSVGTQKELTITEYLTSNIIDLYLAEGEYELTFIADNTQTEGKDYAVFEKLATTDVKEETLYMFPIASLRGIVVDHLDNILKDAEITLTCDKDVVPLESILTDKYGTFIITAVPTGNCLITASSNEYFDQQELAFNQGDFENINLKLEQKTPSRSLNIAFIFLGMVIVLAIGGGMLYWFRHRAEEEPLLSLPSPPLRRKRKSKKKESFPPPQQRSSSPLPLRVQHILPTLREREQGVVQYLLENKHSSTQAKIRHATHIPKTSLMRVLETLKAKNIIEIESVDTIKTVTLTKWFLEK